jgi:hypothetical protein
METEHLVSRWKGPDGRMTVRLPNTCVEGRRDWSRPHSLLLVQRVNTNPRVHGAMAWEGKLFRPGQDVWEDELTDGCGGRKMPVVLETTWAARLDPRYRGRRSWHQLYIVWQYRQANGWWREVSRLEDTPLDAAPELRTRVKKLIQQDAWRLTERSEDAADRMFGYLEQEIHELGTQAPEALAILHALLVGLVLQHEGVMRDDVRKRVASANDVEGRARLRLALRAG